MVRELSDPALRARMMNTACVISSARCGSRTCRSAAAWTRLTWRETSVVKACSDWLAAYSRTNAMSSFIIHQINGRRRQKKTIIFTFRPLHAAVEIPAVLRVVATDGQLPFPDVAILEPDFIRHIHAGIFKVFSYSLCPHSYAFPGRNAGKDYPPFERLAQTDDFQASEIVRETVHKRGPSLE